MKYLPIRELLLKKDEYDQKKVSIAGWVRTIRSAKNLGFIEINDGSHFETIQIVFEADKINNFAEIEKQNVGASLEITGRVVLTPDAKQPFEINADEIIVLGTSTPDFPLQKKRHTREYLRSIAHLRPRTNLYNAVFRVRSAAAIAIHKFFYTENLTYVHTPLITSSDGEGAGEMFNVTTFDLEKEIPKTKEGKVDYGKDFFGRWTGLTVTGQLEAEALAMGLGGVYTFGPTFRAEESHTTRHAAEFWMIEPEIPFMDLEDLMILAENMVKAIINHVLTDCKSEMEFLDSFVSKGLIKRLTDVENSDFKRLSYTDAVEELIPHNDKFEIPVEWGIDLGTEHERFLTEQIYGGPVFVVNYPKEIKAFYMRHNEDGKTVAATDLLIPGIGELIGGSQREERHDVLVDIIKANGLAMEEYWWYLELRKYGSVVHSGFGMGFERMVMYLTGIENIRDVLPFPRTPGSAEF